MNSRHASDENKRWVFLARAPCVSWLALPFSRNTKLNIKSSTFHFILGLKVTTRWASTRVTWPSGAPESFSLQSRYPGLGTTTRGGAAAPDSNPHNGLGIVLPGWWRPEPVTSHTSPGLSLNTHSRASTASRSKFSWPTGWLISIWYQSNILSGGLMFTKYRIKQSSKWSRLLNIMWLTISLVPGVSSKYLYPCLKK